MNSAARFVNPTVTRVLPFVAYVAFLPLGNLVAGMAPEFDIRWLYAIQVGLVAVLLIAFSPGYLELRVFGSPSTRDAIIAVATGAAVFVLWINLDSPWLTMGQSAGFDPSRPDGSIDIALAIVRVAGAALVVPVMEELFWRSFIARWIDGGDFLAVQPGSISIKAVLISSLLFGVEHFLWFAGVLAGLAYCAVYRKTGNLWVPIIAHAVTNAMLGTWILHTRNWQFW